MSKVKKVSIPLTGHFRLSIKQCSISEKDKEDMKKVPYVPTVSSLMYAMICTKSDIAHAVGVVSGTSLILVRSIRMLSNGFSSISRELSNCVFSSIMAKPC